MLSAWLPGTHGAYYEKMKDKVVNLAINYPDARIGLIVPEYVSANGIADLRRRRTLSAAAWWASMPAPG